MENHNNDHGSQQPASKSNKTSAGNERENPQKKPGKPLPNKPTTPAKPDKNPDPTKPRPGGNEPEKNDPTRIDEPLKTPIAKSEPLNKRNRTLFKDK
ncbi:MAG TPA: hypothetical protein VF411_03180 [Bacteroidia bacterium]